MQLLGTVCQDGQLHGTVRSRRRWPGQRLVELHGNAPFALRALSFGAGDADGRGWTHVPSQGLPARAGR